MRAAVFVFAAMIALPIGAGSTEPKPPSAEQVFRAFGLFGTWAVDCQRPAAPDNPHVSDTLPGPGEIVESHDLGPDGEINRYKVVSAKPISKTRVSVSVVFKPGSEGEQHQHLVFRMRDDTRRTLFNQPDGGAARVKDGLVVGYGVKTPTLHKCE